MPKTNKSSHTATEQFSFTSETIPFFISIPVMPAEEINKEVVSVFGSEKFPYKIAGVWLFPNKHLADSDNPEQAKTLVRNTIAGLKQRLPNCLVAVDLECQGVNRLEALMPKDMRLCNGDLVRILFARGYKELARELVEKHFELLSSVAHDVGINLLCGPVLDLYVDKQGYRSTHKMHLRSWAESADAAAYLFKNVAKICCKNGVIPIFKHLPGIGHAYQDTHYGTSEIARDPVSSTPLLYEDLPAFARVFKSSLCQDTNNAIVGVVAGMVSHCIYSDVRSDNGKYVDLPASCSPEVLKLIRKELAVVPESNLVLFSDAVDMQGFTRKMQDEGYDPKIFGAEVFHKVCLQGVIPMHGAIEARELSELFLDIFIICENFQKQCKEFAEAPHDSLVPYREATKELLRIIDQILREFEGFNFAYRQKENNALRTRVNSSLDMELVYSKRPFVGTIKAFHDNLHYLKELLSEVKMLIQKINDKDLDVRTFPLPKYFSSSIDSIVMSAERLCAGTAQAVVTHTDSMLKGFYECIEKLVSRKPYENVQSVLKKLQADSKGCEELCKGLLAKNKQITQQELTELRQQRLAALYQKYDKMLQDAESVVALQQVHSSLINSTGSSGGNMPSVGHSSGGIGIPLHLVARH